MASNSSDSFSKSLEKFRDNLSEEQKQEFSLSSIEDVELAIQQIQERIGPEKKLRNFTRIRKFLEAMKQVEELVKIFLNVHEVVAFIWVRLPKSVRSSISSFLLTKRVK
jgi:NADH dehydrogenase/NADH:ubiquinone oxidoreductase subunit G